MIIIGIIWGLLIVFMSVMVGGAGHGWITAFKVGLIAIFTAPLTAVAFQKRGTDTAKHLALAALVFGILGDIVLIIGTLDEGIHYVKRAGELAYLWLFVWLSWQIVALIVVLTKKRKTTEQSE